MCENESPMPWPEPITLRGSHAILEPLSLDHQSDLVEAVQDGELWKLWYTAIAPPDKMQEEIDRRLDLQSKGTMLPFVVIDTRTAKAVGMTTYMNIDAPNRRVEIGATWYRKSMQRTPLNTECKLLLLTHAFESLDCICVEIRTHFFNHASRQAIERLGPSWTEYCGTIRCCRMGRSATPACTASSQASGQW